MLKNQSKQLLTKMGAHQTSKASSCKPNCKSRAHEETGNSKMLNQETYFVFHILFECLSSRVILIINLATGWNDPPKCIFFYFKKCFKEKKQQHNPVLHYAPSLIPVCYVNYQVMILAFQKSSRKYFKVPAPIFLFFIFCPWNLYEPPAWSKLPEVVRRHVSLGLPVWWLRGASSSVEETAGAALMNHPAAPWKLACSVCVQPEVRRG